MSFELYFVVSTFWFDRCSCFCCSHRSDNVSSPLRDVELTSAPSTGLGTPVVVEKVRAEAAGIASSSRVPPSTAEDLEVLDHVSLSCSFLRS